jgi:pyruvate dehydrogenase E2 component (dihydrolipoamide acetyltransferase)
MLRKTIARRMVEAKGPIPHFYLTVDLDMAPAVKLRKELNAGLPESAPKISINDLVIVAAAQALRAVPEVNASFGGDHVLLHHHVDIGVAVAIDDGLLTPVVRDADLKRLSAIAAEVRDLAERGRARKLRPEEMTGSTFSISNLGMFGVQEFQAIINPPEAAILAVGVVQDVPVAKDGQLVVGTRMKATLSCDHRVLDGAIGARWLQALRELLLAPMRLVV